MTHLARSPADLHLKGLKVMEDSSKEMTRKEGDTDGLDILYH